MMQGNGQEFLFHELNFSHKDMFSKNMTIEKLS